MWGATSGETRGNPCTPRLWHMYVCVCFMSLLRPQVHVHTCMYLSHVHMSTWAGVCVCLQARQFRPQAPPSSEGHVSRLGPNKGPSPSTAPLHSVPGSLISSYLSLRCPFCAQQTHWHFLLIDVKFTQHKINILKINNSVVVSAFHTKRKSGTH